MSRSWIFPSVILLVVGLYGCNAKPNFPDISQTTYTLTTGKKLRMSELNNRPVIVTFWATSCAACIKEIPDLIQLYQSYSSAGLEIIAIAMPYDRPDHVLEFVKKHRLPYRVSLDVEAKLVRAFGNVRVTPNNFLIDPDGKISHQQIGILDIAHTEKWLQARLTSRN